MTTRNTLAPAPDAAGAIAPRTFRSVLEGLRISATAKRELLALHDAEIAREREAAEAACTPAALVEAARESARAAGEMGFYEGVRAHASETQRFAGDAYDGATEAHMAAMRRWRESPGPIAFAAVDAAEEGIAAAKAYATLPEGHPRRHGLGPQPGAALAWRASTEAGPIAVRREGDE